MNTLQIVGLVLAAIVTPTVGAVIRVYARKHWNNPAGVKWRETSGVALVLAVAASYEWLCHPPIPILAVLAALATEVLFVLLVFESTNTLQDEPWEGMTENGNYRHRAIRHQEDVMAILQRIFDDQEMLALHTRQLQRDTVMAKLVMKAMRAMEPTQSVRELERRVDSLLRGEGEE